MSDGRVMTGRLAGIARHAVPKGPMEVIDTAIVTLDGGVEGDARGRLKHGGRGRRQVPLIKPAHWGAPLAEIRRAIPLPEHRADPLVAHFDHVPVTGIQHIRP